MDQADLEGRTVIDIEGNKVGEISAIYVDPETQRPQWGLIRSGLLGGNENFVPLSSMQPDGENLRVPYAKEQIAQAPKVDAEGELSVDDEAALAQHYGLGYATAASSSGVVTDVQEPSISASGSGSDQVMTRSEEEMRIGTVRRPSELVRLRKTVVTEPVSQTVPLQREELRIEREPITSENRDAALADPEISEATHEITLSQEEPVIEKRTVPVEQVRIDKDVTTEDREVIGEVRKERIEVERQSQR